MRAENILAKIFLICISFIFSLALVEIGSNYYLWDIATVEQFNLYASIDQIKERYGQDFYVESKKPQFQPHHYLGYVTTYNYAVSENRHNSLGFRGDEISIEKPDGIYRIVAIGASTTYGTSVESPEAAYPAQLETYLHDSGYPNIEVINAGVGGYTSHETLMNLQFRVLELDPDLILVYQGSNDIIGRFVFPLGAYRGDNSGYRAPVIHDTVIPQLWEYSTALRIIGIQLGWTTSQSGIEWNRSRDSLNNYFRRLRTQYRSGTSQSEVSAMEMLRANPPIYFEQNLRNIVGSSYTNNIDILLMTYAIYSQFDTFIANSEESRFALGQHNDITTQVADEMETYFLDIASIFPDDERYFADGRHMTRDGNQLRAQLIGDYIIESILYDQPSD